MESEKTVFLVTGTCCMWFVGATSVHPFAWRWLPNSLIFQVQILVAQHPGSYCLLHLKKNHKHISRISLLNKFPLTNETMSPAHVIQIWWSWASVRYIFDVHASRSEIWTDHPLAFQKKGNKKKKSLLCGIIYGDPICGASGWQRELMSRTFNDKIMFFESNNWNWKSYDSKTLEVPLSSRNITSMEMIPVLQRTIIY